jgi:hypothetical protein
MAITSISKINDYLYLSDEIAAESKLALSMIKPKTIIRVCNTPASLTIQDMYQQDFDITLIHIPFEDMSEVDLLEKGEEVHLEIERLRNENKTPILIHCRMGISRSPAVICYHLIKASEFRLGFGMVWEEMLTARPIVWLNDGFAQQLLAWTKKDKRVKVRVAKPKKQPFVQRMMLKQL